MNEDNYNICDILFFNSYVPVKFLSTSLIINGSHY